MGTSTTRVPTTTSASGASTHPYDCQAGYGNWLRIWAENKKRWCCVVEVSCLLPTTTLSTIARSLPTTSTTPLTATMTTTMTTIATSLKATRTVTMTTITTPLKAT